MNPNGEEKGILDIILVSTFISWLILNVLLLLGLVSIEHLVFASILSFALLASLLAQLVLYVFLLGNPIKEAKE